MSTTQPLAPSPRRENCFDALRLFAALTVMIFHVVTHFQAPFLWVTIENQAWFLDGVPLFFILSGLLIYQSLDRCQRDGRPLNQFYVNRFLRVAPAIYVYAPIAVVTLLLAGALQWKALISLPFLGWLVSTYLLVPVYHPTTFQSIGVGVLNGSLWTIPAECGFYLIAPLLLRLERRWGFQAFIIALGVVALAMHALYIGLAMHSPEALTTKLLHVTFLPYLLYFGLGIFWARVWPIRTWSANYFWAALAAYAVLRFAPVQVGQVLGPHYALTWYKLAQPRLATGFSLW